MVGHHPSIRQVNIFLELNSEHFGVYLHHNAFEPVMNTFTALVMITKYLNAFTHLVWFLAIGCRCKM